MVGRADQGLIILLPPPKVGQLMVGADPELVSRVEALTLVGNGHVSVIINSG